VLFRSVFEEFSLSFTQPTSWAALAKEHGCDYKVLRRLNPHLAFKNPLKGGPWTVRFPQGAKRTLGT
jgi:hypothetical protein